VIVERPALERRVIAAIDAERIPVLLGGCGSGRTSLLLRLARLSGPDRSQYLDFSAAATTPERCLMAIRQAPRFQSSGAAAAAAARPGSPRAAFDTLLNLFDQTTAVDGGPLLVLIDEVLDIRTFENFPGLRHVQREFTSRLAESPSRFVLASRFTARAHRLLRDAPARFEVIHVPPLDPAEVLAAAMRFDGGHPEWARAMAPAVTVLTDGRAGCVTLLLEALAALGEATDPVAAVAALFAPDGRLTARCRESYEFRLNRARGYGALKAILGVLAADEPLTLTEISHHLDRTPGSTKDYLSWLEDVDLVTVQGKRYAFEDPLLRLYVRLYGRAVPPTDDDIVSEVGAFAKARLPAVIIPPAPAVVTREAQPDSTASGIIEID
jgi:hypothetical protein